jgi:hypothetical protein
MRSATVTSGVLYVSVGGGEPCDGGGLFHLGDEVFAAAAERVVGIVADFAAGDVGHLGVEQRGKRAQNAALGLAAETEQDEVVAGEDGMDDLRDDGVFVTQDAGEERLGGVGTQAGDEIFAELVLDAAVAKAFL